MVASTATPGVLRRGRRLVIAEADVHNAGRLVAKGLGTFAVIPRP